MLKLNEMSRDLTVRPITLLSCYCLLRWNVLTFFSEKSW